MVVGVGGLKDLASEGNISKVLVAVLSSHVVDVVVANGAIPDSVKMWFWLDGWNFVAYDGDCPIELSWIAIEFETENVGPDIGFDALNVAFRCVFDFICRSDEALAAVLIRILVLNDDNDVLKGVAVERDVRKSFIDINEGIKFL